MSADTTAGLAPTVGEGRGRGRRRPNKAWAHPGSAHTVCAGSETTKSRPWDASRARALGGALTAIPTGHHIGTPRARSRSGDKTPADHPHRAGPSRPSPSGRASSRVVTVAGRSQNWVTVTILPSGTNPVPVPIAMTWGTDGTRHASRLRPPAWRIEENGHGLEASRPDRSGWLSGGCCRQRCAVAGFRSWAVPPICRTDPASR